MYVDNNAQASLYKTTVIEGKLFNLLNNLSPIFIKSEIKEVKNFIDICEYGLALQTAVNIIEEKKKSPPNEVFTLLYDLAETISTVDTNFVVDI